MQPTTSNTPAARQLEARLRSELRWLRLRLWGHGLLVGFVSAGLILLAAVLSYPGWSSWGPGAARAILAAVGLSLAWNLYFEVWRPLRRVANLEGFSRELEKHGDYRNLLEAATQFTSRRQEDPLQRGASPELVEEILRRATEVVRSMRLAPRIPLSDVVHLVPAALLLVLVWLWAGVASPGRVHQSLAALAQPSRLQAPHPTTGLFAVSGDLRVPVGSRVELRARDFVGGEEEVFLEVDRTGGFWQQQPVEMRAGEGHPPQYYIARAELEGIQDPFRYRFRKGTLVSAEHRVDIRQRPVLRELRLRLIPPSYSGLAPEERIDPSGTLDLLEGSQVELSGRASSPLSRALRREVKGIETELEVDSTRFRDHFVLEEDMRFHLDLVDDEGLESETNTLYVFLAREDRAPTVEITAPGEDRHLDRSLRVGVAGLATDDLGLESLTLLTRVETRSEWRRIPLYVAGDSLALAEEILDWKVEPTQKEVAIAFTWDLGEVELLPGDAVLYALEAADNDALDGPNLSRTPIYRLRLPTIAEVFDLDRDERAENQAELSQLREQGREIAQDLQRLDRELKKDPNPSWEKQQEIKEVLERQQELRQQLQELADDLQRRQEDFERENAGSVEMLQKMEMVQELLQDLKDDQSLQAYLDAMEEAMERLGPQEVQRHMEDAVTDQEELNRRLDRTLELLRQLERERAMSDLREEVADHLQRQEEIADQTLPSPSEESDSDSEEPLSDEELTRAQEQLRQEAEQLEEKLRRQIEALREQMEKEGSDPVADQMEQSLEEALDQLQKEGKPSEAMEDAGQELQEGEREQARDSQDEALSRLLHLYKVLSDGMQGMQQASGKAAFEKLQQTAFDLLDLSHGEEKVVDALRGGIRGQQIRPIARQHARVTRGATRLSEGLHDLAQKNFLIPERLLSEMRSLLDLLEDGDSELKLSRARRSRDVAVESMAKMNRIVIGLLTAAENAQGQGGGSGQPSPSQQMQQMSEEQSRLNGMTQELRKKMEEGFSPEERRQLAQMQARQRALREQLQSLRDQLEDERRVLGDLDELQRSMEEVAEDLGAGRLTEDTQRQQDQILSRLLDAQRSVRERDFSKRRQARGADQLFRPQVGAELPNLTEDDRGRLRRWQAPDVVPRDYRDEVRRYFRSLDRKLDGRQER